MINDFNRFVLVERVNGSFLAVYFNISFLHCGLYWFKGVTSGVDTVNY